jgi:type VI secretion system protein ImpA
MSATITAIPLPSPARSAPGAKIDVAAILEPITGPSPAGVSLHYETEYDRIREARRDEDPNLPQGVWRRDIKRADWNLVVALSAEALTRQSKDLQIAAWLTEALVYRDGLEGLAEGVGIIIELCDRFWPNMYPAISDGDIGARVAPIEWLNEKAAQAIYTLPLTRSGTTEPISYSWTDYANAQRRDMARSESTAEASLEAILASSEATPTAFYEELREQIALCSASIDALKGILSRSCEDQDPGFGQFREALRNIAGFVDTALAQRGDTRKRPVHAELPTPQADAAIDSDVTEVVNSAVEELSSLRRIQIRNRDEAYRLLMEIADYLFSIEPHSPTPYIVQRAASWGMMPLHKLLVELTRGSNDLAVLFELLGIGKDDETAGHRRGG